MAHYNDISKKIILFKELLKTTFLAIQKIISPMYDSKNFVLRDQTY